MIRWTCGVELRKKLSCIELRLWLAVKDMTYSATENRLPQYGHVLRKEDNDWVKMCYFGA